MQTLDQLLSTAKQRARNGQMRVTDESMDIHERELHVRYSIPASVDLSAEATARTSAKLAADVDAEIADATARYEQWLACQGKSIERDVSPVFQTVPQEVMERARRLCDMLETGNVPGLYVCGLPGRGKTSTAQWLLKDWTGDGWGGEFVTERQYLEAVKATFDGHGSADDVRSRYWRAGLLVLDDLGKSVPRPWMLEELFALVDWRYTNALRLVVTSNMTLEALEADWAKVDPGQTAALMSRLRAMCAPVALTGPDHRPQVRVV